MKYKILLISAIMFILSGFFIGTVFNKNLDETISVVVLSFLNLFFISMMLVAFKLLKNNKGEDFKKGYITASKEIMASVHLEYGDEGMIKVTEAFKKVVSKNAKKRNKVHMYMHQ